MFFNASYKNLEDYDHGHPMKSFKLSLPVSPDRFVPFYIRKLCNLIQIDMFGSFI